ncbi:MAG: TIGR01777 family oxidoreductase, partial [Actinomycetota bacterium]
MKVLVTGSSGLVGTSLTAALQQESHNVLKAVRRPPTRSDEVFWNPDEGHIDQTQLHGVDAVVHLAGENIGRKRWTRRHKQTILQSRVTGTRLIVEAIANLNLPPAVLVSASAIGFYGDRGSETLTEDSGSGIGFRAEVCREWEAATSSAEAAGIRVVKLRSGLVLSTDGGILPYLLRPASLGLSFRVGSGTQYWSWISIEDEVRAILFALEKT